MASIRPVTRVVTRRITKASTSASISTLFPRSSNNSTISLKPQQLQGQQLQPTLRYLSTSPFLSKSSSSRYTGSVSAENLPNPPPGPNTSDQVAASKSTGNYQDGAPGDPTEPIPSGISPSKIYSFEDIQSLTSSSSPSSSRILVDVREPSEVLGTGRIPGALNLPISSAPDAFFLSAEEFEDKFGWERPKADSNVEVIFYCKAGVRSKAAARLAGQAGFGGKVGEYPGSWVDWESRGGQIEKD